MVAMKVYKWLHSYINKYVTLSFESHPAISFTAALAIFGLFVRMLIFDVTFVQFLIATGSWLVFCIVAVIIVRTYRSMSST